MSTNPLASPARAVVLVLLAALCVGAWAVHLLALTSLARLNEDHHSVVWVMQAVTVLCAVPCLITVAVGWSAVRRTGVPEDEGSPIGRTVFLAWMAIAVGLFNLLLVVLEAVYVVLINRNA
jgi:hypothetical protein